MFILSLKNKECPNYNIHMAEYRRTVDIDCVESCFFGLDTVEKHCVDCFYDGATQSKRGVSTQSKRGVKKKQKVETER